MQQETIGQIQDHGQAMNLMFHYAQLKLQVVLVHLFQEVSFLAFA